MTATLETDPSEAANERAGFDRWGTLFSYFAGWMNPRRALIEVSYIIPERGGWGWYVVTKNPVFNFELNDQLAEFAARLIRKGFSIHAALIPGSSLASVPTDGIAITPFGGVTAYASEG